MLLAAIPCLAEENYDGLTCKDGESELCEDLTGAKVRVVNTTTFRVHGLCGWQARACAKLRINEEEVSCTIYVYAKDRETLYHEYNHCRGWNHRRTRYDEPWTPFPAVIENQTFLKRNRH